MNAALRATTGESASHAAGKAQRQRLIRELVARQSIGSQDELVEELRNRGHVVTQATISRDIGELGLVKIARADRHVYVSPADLATPPPSDEHLRRIVGDIPVRVGRSGLILLLTGSPGTASVLGQAIDESTMDEQEGTLAGDNTLLVLFRDEVRLTRWLARFRAIQGRLPEPAEPDFVTLSGPSDGSARFTEAPR
jgi:transcriptional regulator of arginine metabolism